jgi:hypothetical protein
MKMDASGVTIKKGSAPAIGKKHLQLLGRRWLPLPVATSRWETTVNNQAINGTYPLLASQ